jgi:MFS family permease
MSDLARDARSGPELAHARRRARWTLVSAVALGSTGYIAAVTVTTIVARDLLGSGTWAGLPGAGIVLGAAAGAVLLSQLMSARGRRPGLVLGYATVILGSLIAVAAILARSFPLLVGGVVVIGFGNAANQLARYAAADMVPPQRRAWAIGLVVWASTVGSVAGPSLVPIAGRLAQQAGLPDLAGPFLLPAVFAAVAGLLVFVLLRPDPFDLADETAPDEQRAVGITERLPISRILRRPGVAAAIVALVVGQLVMVLIMTMTPLHMVEHGSDLAAVGIVISAHTLGMFALSPLSGRLTDRFGPVPTIFAGTALLAGSSLLAAAAPPAGGPALIAALFILGWGWNLGFVAGSALLSEHLELHERTRVQGAADAMIWSSSAAASLGSGLIMATVGYAALGIMGAGMVAIPVLVLRANRRVLGARDSSPDVDTIAS